MFGWFKSRPEYRPPDNALGRAAQSIGMEIAHTPHPSIGNTLEDLVRILEVGQDLGVLKITNNGTEPDEYQGV